MVTPYLFQTMIGSQFAQNARFGVPSQHGKWGGVLQGETAIAAGVFQNLP